MMSQEARALLGRLAAEGVSPWLSDGGGSRTSAELLRSLAEEPGLLGLFAGSAASRSDVRAFCDALRAVFDLTGGKDGWVSTGLGAHLTDDAATLVAAAEQVWSEVDRPNVQVRMPATPEGQRALTLCLARGISVESTPILSVGRLGDVLDAYVEGMERALANGVRLERLAFTASLPIGLLDVAVNARLGRLPVGSGGSPQADVAALAVARLAYRAREKRLDDRWWSVLRRAGAASPRLAWMGLRFRHINSVVGWNTVQEVSVESLEAAAREHALRGDTLLNASGDGHRALVALKRHGIDVAEVASALESTLTESSPAGRDPGSTPR
ncbi:transaldolase family protein [Streptacidiphilus fuscans]|uniref:Transaldolase n=1 Tax=Streptacidiphilus fuscans TaxID=2789292 RepID=A0A931FDJ7_9ACTN|nr:transaldolase family protein [Streptacidiphilus fuscans]MBF9070787.1 hypothetical protein [Streptacidiphilus fuscans]